jgi:adenylate cyclase
MTAQEVKRKLVAILSADVKGYSRLMGEDEEGTIRTLNTYKEAMSNLIQQQRGRVIDAPGDNVLAEFASVVDAVRCAVEIQKELKNRNAQLPENRRMEFRIGVNLGDVVEDGEQILGDGVNIAARLESLSEAGGICISGKAYDEIKNKLSLGYKYLGEQAVKNIAEPVRVYRVLMEPEAAGKLIGEKKAKPRHWQRTIIGLVVAVIVVVAAVVIWRLYIRHTPPIEVASKEKMAFPLPDKPSIAVLPFVNMSGDPKQEFFCDGMSEEIITALSKSPDLFVVARNSTFVYKGKAVKIKQVSEELSVRYVMEGSVQREGDRVRVTVQLIDALSGYHVWAERYDRPFREILALQDEITIKIMAALHVKLEARDHARVVGKGAKNLEAYLKAIEARECVYRVNREDNVIAKKLAQEAIALDPEYAMGYALLATTHMLDVMLGTTKFPMESLTRAIELIRKAISMDESDGKNHAFLARLYAMAREYDKGFAEVERALALDPNSPETSYQAGVFLAFAGKPEEAISLFQKAVRLNPFPPFGYYNSLSGAYRVAGQHEEAIAAAKQAVQRGPQNIFTHIALAAACSTIGRDLEAQAAAAEVMKINPKFSLEQYSKTLYFKNKTDTDRTIEALRKAGLK